MYDDCNRNLRSDRSPDLGFPLCRHHPVLSKCPRHLGPYRGIMRVKGARMEAIVEVVTSLYGH